MSHTPVADRFRGHVAIVTGGACGIGRAIVEELLKEGSAVVFTGISNAGSATIEALRSQGFDALFLRGDMADEAFCRRVVERTLELHGRVDHLVNNAFSFTAKAIDGTTADWMRSFTAGPLAYVRMVQNVLAPMRQAGGGSIVNMSSISAYIAQPTRWTYNAAKGAVAQLTKCQALDLAPFNIRVNSVAPAWILVQRDRQGSRPGWRRPREVGPDLGQVSHAPAARRRDRGRPAHAVPTQRRRVLHYGHEPHGRWRLLGHGPGGSWRDHRERRFRVRLERPPRRQGCVSAQCLTHQLEWAPRVEQASGCGFDCGPGVAILELLRAEVAQRGM